MDTPARWNLGMGLNAELRRMAEQALQLQRVTRTSRAYDQIIRSGELFRERLEASVRAAESIGAETRRALELVEERMLSRSREVARLEKMVMDAGAMDALVNAQRIGESFRLEEEKIRTLFGGTVTMSALLEQARFEQMLDRLGPAEGLFGRITAGVNAKAAADPGAAIEVGDVVEVSAVEIGKLEPSILAKIDVSQLLYLVLALFFTYLVGSGTNNLILQEGAASRSRDAEIREDLEEVTSLVKGLVDLSLTASTPNGGLRPTHALSRGLHLRSAPSASASSLGKFPSETKVQVLIAVGGWSQVAVQSSGSKSVSGWMYAKYLQPIE